MKLFRNKVWSALDIGLLKVCCMLIGMIAGAHLGEEVKQNLWLVVVLALALGIKPAISYFRNG